MSRLRVDLIVGARPNLVKAAPLHAALRAHPSEFDVRLVHTGQHYDERMSDVFFRDLGLPTPDVHLQVGSANAGAQTGEIMIRYERAYECDPPDLVIVVGDVNSTLACALVAVQHGAALAHVEAGLRSFDRRMLEEINRVVTDRISDLLFTPSADADQNLLREGTPAAQIFLVGNVLIDALAARESAIDACRVLDDMRLERRRYGVVTLHRPENVDDADHLAEILESLAISSADLALVFPVHPRTRETLTRLEGHGRQLTLGTARLTDPLGYLDFLKLVKESALVITDSGGVQEETTYLGIPCLTVREQTERPVTVTEGTNIVVGRDRDRLQAEVARILAGRPKVGTRPALWDGWAASRIIEILRAYRRGEIDLRRSNRSG
jgi:UDP-N-acetylglucosamine 2-epimerase (non-hydrolysing)